MGKQWGIYDTKDNCWLGSNDQGTGPKVFTEDEFGNDAKVMAKLAAQIADVRCGWSVGRSREREYLGQATRVRDEVPVYDTTENVIRKLEKGVVI